MRDVLVVPGFHGSAVLFDDFVRAAPDGFRPRALTLPTTATDRYDGILRELGNFDDVAPGAIVVAESFGGPLGVLLAESLDERASLLVLVNTFLRFPFPRAFRPLPWNILVELGARPASLRWAFANGDAAWGRRLREAWVGTPKPAIHARVRAAMAADVRPNLARLRAPVLLLDSRHDRVIPPGNLREIRSCRPDATVESFDAPHILLQVAPAAAWAAIAKRG